MVSVNLNENERQTFSLAPNRDGVPKAIQPGSLAFTTQVGSAVGEVVDDSTVLIRAMGVAGPINVLLTADADMGEGVVTISETFEGNASPLFANSFGVTPVGGPEVDPNLP